MTFAEQQHRAHIERQRRLGKTAPAPIPPMTVPAPAPAPQPDPRTGTILVASLEQAKMIETLQQDVAKLVAELAALKREDASPLVVPNRIKPVIRTVTKYYGVSLCDLVSRRRGALVRPRQMAMFLARTLTECSLPAIGRLLNRDHSTILHGCRKITTLRLQDTKLDAEIRELTELMTPSTECGANDD
jgi:hypothetical protein